MKRTIAMMAVALCAFLLSGRATAEEADKAAAGKTAFTKYKCNNCHSIDAAEIKRLRPVSKTATRKPPDLSKVGDQRDHEWIEKFLQKTEKIEGKAHPFTFRGTKDQREAIAAWLATMKAEGGAAPGASGAAKEALEEAKEAKEEAKEAKEAAKEVKEDLKEHEKGTPADTTHAH